ncbi:class F sortase [Micromonospora sp. WMMC241]|uniref:class F sortase n=1 Tax=Micromonospora sp. WMMC241 TaxID=3015159 RepID=UPI0022B70476|nr:class F sortase [Micromonospora sp. WMMC241]MCZ7435753.1 class F sortase [Micromonospora sp. WMMC241]
MVGSGLIGASVRTEPPPTPPQPQPIAQAGPTDTADPAGVPDADVATAAPWDWTPPTTPAPTVPAPSTGPTTPGAPTGRTPAVPPAGAVPPGGAVPPATAGAVPAAPPGSPAGARGVPAGLPRSAPTTIAIPRIGVRAEIMTLGTNPDGTVQVPPLDQAMKAGWYSPGASPGEVGNAVVVGHVDSAKLGPAVFFNLGALVRGDTITVSRQDGSTATFTVDEVRSYPKTAFPAEQVYGPSGVPGLRVVTCGGVFDRSAGSYLNNIVVYAHMTA